MWNTRTSEHSYACMRWLKGNDFCHFVWQKDCSHWMSDWLSVRWDHRVHKSRVYEIASLTKSLCVSSDSDATPSTTASIVIIIIILIIFYSQYLLWLHFAYCTYSTVHNQFIFHIVAASVAAASQWVIKSDMCPTVCARVCSRVHHELCRIYNHIFFL